MGLRGTALKMHSELTNDIFRYVAENLVLLMKGDERGGNCRELSKKIVLFDEMTMGQIMVRVSSESNQEQVRVAKSALKSGITFARVGAAYIQKYRELPGVRHVRLIFATDPPALKELIANARQVDAITKTLTHILDGLPTDCGHCTLKPVCDEVEGMSATGLPTSSSACRMRSSRRSETFRVMRSGSFCAWSSVDRMSVRAFSNICRVEISKLMLKMAEILPVSSRM